MKKVLCLLCVILTIFITTVSVADAYVSVKGFTNKNGTYVPPSIRSKPNGLKSDNYGYKGGEIYNKTYGTKGAYWDTPTYITDPNYNIGKNMYGLSGVRILDKGSVTPLRRLIEGAQYKNNLKINSTEINSLLLVK